MIIRTFKSRKYIILSIGLNIEDIEIGSMNNIFETNVLGRSKNLSIRLIIFIILINPSLPSIDPLFSSNLIFKMAIIYHSSSGINLVSKLNLALKNIYILQTNQSNYRIDSLIWIFALSLSKNSHSPCVYIYNNFYAINVDYLFKKTRIICELSFRQEIKKKRTTQTIP